MTTAMDRLIPKMYFLWIQQKGWTRITMVLVMNRTQRPLAMLHREKAIVTAMASPIDWIHFQMMQANGLIQTVTALVTMPMRLTSILRRQLIAIVTVSAIMQMLSRTMHPSNSILTGMRLATMPIRTMTTTAHPTQ